jgi:UV excision repair protein RAD23
MLEPILQQVGAGNPQLAALIGQHPEQFLQLLSEDADNDAPLPPGAQATQISVTAEEREAIERVSDYFMNIGFDTNLVLVMSSWLSPRPSYPSLLCLRQERGAGSQFSL